MTVLLRSTLICYNIRHRPLAELYTGEFTMEGYRVATPKDYQLIVDHLNAGDKQAVMLLSQLRLWAGPHSMLEICQGPFVHLSDRIVARSKEGVQHELRLVDDNLNHLEILAMGSVWQAPDLGYVQILIKLDAVAAT